MHYGTCHEYHNSVVYPGWLSAGADLSKVGEPVADWYDEQAVAYQSVTIPFAITPVGDLDNIKVTPFVRATTNVGPTNAPLPPAAVLSHDLQVIDLCTPNTDWGGGFLQYNQATHSYEGDRQGTYLTAITALKTVPLELPRYSYAAIDTDALYKQAQDKVAALYGREEMP